MIQRNRWNINEFSNINLPEIVATNVEIGKSYYGIRVLDLPIHIPGQGFAVPSEIQHFNSIIESVFEWEKKFSPDIYKMYVYITIDQKWVDKGTTGRRPGAHADGYIATDTEQIDIISQNAKIIAKEKSLITHTYVWYDCIPTEFFTVPFPLTDTTDEGSLETFDEIADSCSPNQIRVYDNKSILFLTPYVIHRSAIALSGLFRTFVKVSVSDQQFRRKGNSKNPSFVYNWDMEMRCPSERNTPWIS